MLPLLQDKVYRDCLLYPDLTQGGTILISFLSVLKNNLSYVLHTGHDQYSHAMHST